MTTTRPPTTTLPTAVADVLDEAVGRRHRDDPALPGTGGPAGNARLTAWTGLILLVVILAQLVTLLDVNGLISWHVGLGTLLLVLAVVKTGSTGWRVVRYYRGDRSYRRAGPPPLVLRLLGPLVVLSTFAVVGSGIVLVALGPATSRRSGLTLAGFRVDWVTVHQVAFIVFASIVGLHLLARLVPAFRLTVVPRVAASSVAGRRQRLVVLLLAGVVAAGAMALVIPAAQDWSAGGHFHHRHGQLQLRR